MFIDFGSPLKWCVITPELYMNPLDRVIVFFLFNINMEKIVAIFYKNFVKSLKKCKIGFT